MEKFAEKTSKIVFGAVMGLIFLLLIFFETSDYSCKKTFAFSNKFMLAAAAVFFIIVYISLKFSGKFTFKKCNKISVDKIVKIAAVCLFVLQVYISYNILFETDWDSGSTLNFARGFVSGENLDEYGKWYFSTYPNNLFLLFYEIFILKINSVFGIFIGQQQLMCLVIINCALSSCACYLVYKSALLYVKKPFAVLGFALSVLSFGLSPWMVICYSDQLGIILPICSFYFFTKPASGKYKEAMYLSLSVIFACIGYFIKPQCFIILIAIAAFEVFKLFRKGEKIKFQRIVIVAVSVVLAFTATQFGIRIASRKYSIETDPQAKFGMSHFLAMGLNPVERGVYSQEDVDFSSSFSTAKERNAANTEKALERLKSMGFKGAVRFYAGKALTVYNDGTFAWSYEGKFFVTVYPEPNLRSAPFLRDVYCQYGESNLLLITAEQFVWIVILLFSFMSVFVNDKGDKNSEIAVLMLSIIGLTVFEFLFEARARYLYTYVPIFCLLATIGASNVHYLFDKLFVKCSAYRLQSAERR